MRKNKKPTKKPSRFYGSCSILDCNNDVHARGLCGAHYQQARHRGVLPEAWFPGYAGTPEEIRDSIQTKLLRQSQ